MFQHNPLVFFVEALHQPIGIVIWLFWLAVINTASLAFLKEREGRWVLWAWIANIVFMATLYSIVGYNRLLGLSHVIWWTPLVFFLSRRLVFIKPDSLFGRWVVLLVMTNAISLLIDYVDVIRYFIGH